MSSTMGKSWRFVIVSAAFIINLLEIGTFKSFGVFVIPLMESLQTNHMYLGLVMSVSSSGGYLFAPAITKACEHIGERPIIVIGSIMSSASLILSAFADDVMQLGILFTVSGFGTSMAFIAVVIAISNCFTGDNKATAIGVACSGGALGVMIFPPLVEQLIENLGWRGAMQLVGATNANLVVCGLLVRPKQTSQAYSQLESSDGHEQDPEDAETSGHYLNLISKYIHSILEPFNVLANKPVFITIIIARFFSTIAYSGWAIFLVPHAIEKGLSSNTAALLSSVGGIATIFGRLIPGPVIDHGFMCATQLAVLTLLANTAAYVWDYWAQSFWSLSLAALVNGFNFGSDVVIIFPLCVEVLGNKDAIDGYGLSFVPGSVGGMIGGLLIGYLFDHGIGWFLSLSLTSLCSAIMFAIAMLVTKRAKG